MHHWHIALTSLPLLQGQQPIWRLCCTRCNTRSRWYTQTILFCHGSAERCLEEVKIAPPQFNLLSADWTWCYVVMTQRHQPTLPSTETIWTESSSDEQITGMVSAPGRVGWWCCKFLWGTQQKLMLLAMAGSRWEIGWFGVNIWTQASTKILLESSHQVLLIGVIKIWWFYVKSYNINF